MVLREQCKSLTDALMGGFRCAARRDIISVLRLMYDSSRVTKRREAVEESLQCSRAVSQQAEEVVHT